MARKKRIKRERGEKWEPRAVFDYTEPFFNRFQPHSALGCSPLDYENQLVA